MSREQLKDKMKSGLPLSTVATKLGISRPTLYRHMEFYMNGDDSKVNSNLKEYFDNVLMDRYANDEESVKALEQIRFFMDAEKEKSKEDFDRQFLEWSQKSDSYDRVKEDLSSNEKVRRQEELDNMYRVLQDRAKELGIDLELYEFEREGEGEEEYKLKWNDGEIRSTYVEAMRSVMIFIDRDFDRCRDITVELIAQVSGEDFVFLRLRPEENTRFVRLNPMELSRRFEYRLKWSDGETIKYTPKYPLE